MTEIETPPSEDVRTGPFLILGMCLSVILAATLGSLFAV
jgi:hypothetical protein